MNAGHDTESTVLVLEYRYRTYTYCTHTPGQNKLAKIKLEFLSSAMRGKRHKLSTQSGQNRRDIGSTQRCHSRRGNSGTKQPPRTLTFCPGFHGTTHWSTSSESDTRTSRFSPLDREEKTQAKRLSFSPPLRRAKRKIYYVTTDLTNSNVLPERDSQQVPAYKLA